MDSAINMTSTPPAPVPTPFRHVSINNNNNNNNNVPLHAQLQYHSIQSQPPTFHYRPQLRMPQPAPSPAPGEIGFDGKMLRKAMARKTVDYNSSVVRYFEDRIFQKNHLSRYMVPPDILFCPYMMPPQGMLDNPVNSVMTKFIRPATNKNRCPIFCVCWTPDGRRLITGASSGEFTLWNGLTFNFETILQAHDTAVRAMVWSYNEQWMLTGDHNGFLKYWQSNMNNVKMFQAHKDPVRGLSFSPSDVKFASCSDDSSVRIFDFVQCREEMVLRGHGSDVKCVVWHPYKGMVVSGSKDSQQPIILWDPRSGKKLHTLHAHKNTCTDLKWNPMNGNWLLSASRDHMCKLFDIRYLAKDIQAFRGHKKEACAVSWHPIHEQLFASGGSDGSLYFWLVGAEKELAGMDDAHDGMVWDLSWHPLGHMLVTGSNDHTTRFWTRNRPGDTVIEKGNEAVTQCKSIVSSLISRPEELDQSMEEIPGLGTDETTLNELKDRKPAEDSSKSISQGPSNNGSSRNTDDDKRLRKGPYSKPISRVFERAWKTGESKISTSSSSGFSHQRDGGRNWSRGRSRYSESLRKNNQQPMNSSAIHTMQADSSNCAPIQAHDFPTGSQFIHHTSEGPWSSLSQPGMTTQLPQAQAPDMANSSNDASAGNHLPDFTVNSSYPTQMMRKRQASGNQMLPHPNVYPGTPRMQFSNFNMPFLRQHRHQRYDLPPDVRGPPAMPAHHVTNFRLPPGQPWNRRDPNHIAGNLAGDEPMVPQAPQPYSMHGCPWIPSNQIGNPNHHPPAPALMTQQVGGHHQMHNYPPIARPPILDGTNEHQHYDDPSNQHSHHFL